LSVIAFGRSTCRLAATFFAASSISAGVASRSTIVVSFTSK
jgi:hypothetical protein